MSNHDPPPHSVDTHLMKQLDSIHYENEKKQGITLIGTEIHTEYGFSPRKELMVVKSYNLSIGDAKTLLSLSRYSVDTRVHSIPIFIVSSPFVYSSHTLLTL